MIVFFMRKTGSPGIFLLPSDASGTLSLSKILEDGFCLAPSDFLQTSVKDTRPGPAERPIGSDAQSFLGGGGGPVGRRSTQFPGSRIGAFCK
ncbi:hypothetical protein CH378_00895 [Leptospira kmetyi]|uniref:Uncharacterized protein n=1 Tax=Leptospira kmetyi TaxID=408139 RepID=A0ABX4NG13_9LEPT|nr:hypothetical protein CH378_00895 [Leptospira kmetyi]